MQIRAKNDPRYSRKFLIMGVCALGFALYCLYDGFIHYPAERQQGFEEFKQADKAYFTGSRAAMTREEFEATVELKKKYEFDEYIHDRGLHGTVDIYTQYVMAAAMGLAGLYLISLPLRARGRWIEANDEGLTSSWGESFRFDEIESVNKRKWKSKGIAKVTYVANNKRNTFVVDDYKFDRYSTDAIMFELEQRIDPGRIVNGPPEPEPEGAVLEAIQAGGGRPISERVPESAKV